MKFDKYLFAADTGNEGDDQQDDKADKATGDKAAAPPSFDAWLSSQDDTIKELLDGHVDGLKSALDGERKERKALSAKLNAMSKTAEKGSELERQLADLTANLDSAGRKADFYEVAPSNGVKNLRLAWLAAQNEDGVIAKDGTVDFAQLRQVAPELFSAEDKKTTTKSNAGSGQNQGNMQAPSMNTFIRRAAGRR